MLYRFLPKTTFKNREIVDITKSVKLDDLVRKEAINFVPYNVPEGDTPEIVAHDYYDDSSLAWLVMLTNRLVDNYYQWPLGQLQFRKWMVKKYGSLELSQSTILFYEHKTKDITISKDSYDHSATLTYINAGDYSPVYAHDYYERVNDNNSHIVLLNNEQLPLVISDLENMFV